MDRTGNWYMHGNLRLSASEWRDAMDNADVNETLQTMRAINENADWLRAYLRKTDIPVEQLGLPDWEYNLLKRSGFYTLGDMLAHYPDLSVRQGSYMGQQTAKRMRRVIEKCCKQLLTERDNQTAVDDVKSETDVLPKSNIVKERLPVVESEESHSAAKETVPPIAAIPPIIAITPAVSVPAKISEQDLARLKTDITPLEALGLSAHSFNCLKRARVDTVGDVAARYPNALIRIQGFGKKSAEEVCAKIEEWCEHTRNSQVEIPAVKQVETPEELSEKESVPSAVLFRSKISEQDLARLKTDKTPIEDLGLSVRSYNCLKRAKIDTLGAAAARYPNDFIISIRNLGRKSAGEVCAKIEEWCERLLRGQTESLAVEHIETEETVENTAEVQERADALMQRLDGVTALEVLSSPEFSERASEFLRGIATPIEDLGLSARSYNCLIRAKVSTYGELFALYPDKLLDLRNLGRKTELELKAHIERYMERLRKSMILYCAGVKANVELCYSDEDIRESLLAQYTGAGFRGLSFQELRGDLPESVEDERVKKIIGALIAEKQLEYVDFRCYRVYPGFFDILTETTAFMSPEDRDVLRRRFRGDTLEAIAQDYGLTRERIRQKVKKYKPKVRHAFKANTGLDYFDEDFYAYLFTNYRDEGKEFWREYINVPEQTYFYLKELCDPGKKKIAEAIDDPNVAVSLKYRINAYLSRNKIYLDGELVERSRGAIEDFLLRKTGGEEMSSEEFCERYNALLRDNGVTDEKLYYSDAVIRSRTNKLSASVLCLWKQGQRLRFYDIASRDYTELLDSLNLESFENTEISTLKFFEDYPELMRSYDIRDQYELHNLLKKTLPEGSFHDLRFGRQPILQFGEFDRTSALYAMLEGLSPVSSEEFIECIHKEYGYDKATTLASYIQPLMKYCHNSVFSVDFKHIPKDRAQTFRAVLTEDFYFISEIKKLYSRLFPEADAEEINPYSLKGLGFTVLSKYAIQHFDSAADYFHQLLTKDDIYSLKPLRERYGTIMMFSQTLFDLRREYEIFLFGDEQIVNLRRLSRFGITKDDIYSYCDAVAAATEDGEYFTVYSLRQKGLESKLDGLGFDDLFYAWILAMHPDFAYQRVFGSIILLKTNESAFTSTRDFLRWLLSDYDSVDADDFISDCQENYGITIPSRFEITEAISGTDMYYDPIMGRIYSDKNVYYDELSDEPDDE